MFVVLLDMIQERNHLMERVYPQMKNYCLEKHRLEFQVRCSASNLKF